MQAPPGTRETLERLAPVSDQAWDGLQAYANLLAHWQQTLNLVANSTISGLWDRHILDSWQLLPLINAPGSTTDGALVDLGSGAGLPGIILSVAQVPNVHLVEANHRKAAFLTAAAEETGANVSIHACRIEKFDCAPIGKVSVITARALAPLSGLLSLALPLCTADTRLIFPKGRRWQEDLANAGKRFRFDAKTTLSVTDPEAMILEIRCLAHR
jgi:16S rRNA (guanine527-N7)-methyltransferase